LGQVKEVFGKPNHGSAMKERHQLFIGALAQLVSQLQ
jgi:hypothetical protein